MATTTNMEIVLATVSETLGPEWAEVINAAFQTVDLHDHSSGNGVKVTPAGFNVNDDINMNNNGFSNIKAAGMKSQSAADTANTGSIQRIGANLHWISGSGSNVQLTSGSSVNSSGTGELSVDAPASYPYSVTTSDSEVVLTIDTSGGARTLNLPAATNAMTVIVKDMDGEAQANNISVAPNGSDTIDGSNSTYTIDWNNAAVWFISDGSSAWYII